jgi:hypothetical protein
VPLCPSQIQNRPLWDQTRVSGTIRHLFKVWAITLLRVLWVQRLDYLRALYFVLLRFKNRCNKVRYKHPHISKHTQNCWNLLLYTVPSVWYICYLPLQMFPHTTAHTCVIVTGKTKIKPGSCVIQFLRVCMSTNHPNMKSWKVKILRVYRALNPACWHSVPISWTITLASPFTMLGCSSFHQLS